jgi:tRNA pseudouridine(38-40) synthase
VIAAKLEVPNAVELAERGGDISRRDEEQFVAKVNANLPPSVRVYRVFRVNNNFNARYATSTRTYGYFLPEFALRRPGKDLSEYQELPTLFELRQALQCFVGSNLFHNFTDKLSPRDPRARRMIESFTASEPFEMNGKRVIRLQVKGQSFLKHHIRRMIGFAIECLRRGENAKEWIELALSSDKICKVESSSGGMPMAPAESLFLDVASFEFYNQTIQKQQQQLQSAAASASTATTTSTTTSTNSNTTAQPREPIDFVTDAPVRRAREKLISEIILPAVFASSTSNENGGAFEAFEKWLEARDAAEFPPFFFTPNIPPPLQDAQEFLRCVERNRAKRAKLEEYSR